MSHIRHNPPSAIQPVIQKQFPDNPPYLPYAPYPPFANTLCE
jgi:hypothetical protein